MIAPADRVSISLFLLAALTSAAHGQHIHRNGFETPKTFWVPGPFDAPSEVVAHTSTDQVAHTGQRSEYLQLKAQNGKFIYYQYAVGKAPITDELNGKLFLKANRPGLGYFPHRTELGYADEAAGLDARDRG